MKIMTFVAPQRVCVRAREMTGTGISVYHSIQATLVWKKASVQAELTFSQWESNLDSPFQNYIYQLPGVMKKVNFGFRTP